MKVALTGLVFILLTLPAMAQTATCKSQADEKKLAGAAMKSFLTKCRPLEDADHATKAVFDAKPLKRPNSATLV